MIRKFTLDVSFKIEYLSQLNKSLKLNSVKNSMTYRNFS